MRVIRSLHISSVISVKFQWNDLDFTVNWRLLVELWLTFWSREPFGYFQDTSTCKLSRQSLSPSVLNWKTYSNNSNKFFHLLFLLHATTSTYIVAFKTNVETSCFFFFWFSHVYTEVLRLTSCSMQTPRVSHVFYSVWFMQKPHTSLVLCSIAAIFKAYLKPSSPR